MAATYFDITQLPKNTIAGFQHRFRVTARNSDGTTDAGFLGTVHFTSTDPEADLPADYTYVGGDAGVRDFFIRLVTPSAIVVTVTSGLLVGKARTTCQLAPPGWGFDDFGILPYGDAAAGIGSSIRKALAVSTHEVDVTVTNPVQDNSAFLPGDALNPSTWTVQRLDTAEVFNVVAVTQVGTFTYRLLVLQPFASVKIVHRASSSTLLDTAGNLINNPRFADFLGLTEAAKSTFDAQLATKKVASRDVANAQTPSFAVFAGTLQLDGGGDYKLVTGTELTKKLIFRRLISKPGDFFHLPQSGPNAYGVGLRVKEPLPASELPKLKAKIEQQVLREPSVQDARAFLTLDPANNILNIRLQAVEKKSGQQVEIGFKVTEQGVVL